MCTQIRVAPTPSDPQTLRLEPSFLISDEDTIARWPPWAMCAKLRAHDYRPRATIEGDRPANDDSTRVTFDTKFHL
jgi:hypothetical protein